MKTKIFLGLIVLLFAFFTTVSFGADQSMTFEWEQAADDLPENGGDLDHWELFSTTDNALPFDQWRKEGDVPYAGQAELPYNADFTIIAPDGQETNFWFKMTAVDTAGNSSDPSDYQEGHPTLVDFKPPPAPVASGDYNNQTKTVTLTWTQADPDGDVASWKVYKSSVAGGPYTEIGDGTSPYSYVVQPSDSGKWLYFTVVAFDNNGNFSPNSNEVAVKLAMGVPFNLKVTVSSQ